MRQLCLKTLFCALAALSFPSAASAADDIVLYASDASTAGTWRKEAYSSAAGGTRLRDPNQGDAKLSTAVASPSSVAKSVPGHGPPSESPIPRLSNLSVS